MDRMILKMDANVVVKVGMRVHYDCPSISTEDYRADQFFREHKGKTGVIVGFSTEYVRILDGDGRLPGIYGRPGCIDVRFDGEVEVHKGLNLRHFVLISQSVTAAGEVPLTHQKFSDLPHPVTFYPGDVVYKKDDLLRQPRVVEEVTATKDGFHPVYILQETADDRRDRLEQKSASDEAERERGFVPSSMSFERTENCFGDDIELVSAGNLHLLHTDPAKMRFGSSEEEIFFWTREGLSKSVTRGSGIRAEYEYSLADAISMVESAEGDIILRSKTYENVIMTERNGEYRVRRLHSRFEPFRDRVRSLMRTTDPIEEDMAQVSPDLDKFMRTMA